MNLSKNAKLYIVVGGKGQSSCIGTVCYGGYNGGGSAGYYTGITDSMSGVTNGAGGGATHIATIAGLLSSLSNSRSNIIIVAGGGSGASYHCNGGDTNRPTCPNYSSHGGSGGGSAGGGKGGTQTQAGDITVVNSDKPTPGGFGYGGGNICSSNGASGSGSTRYCYAPGAGGGYYGGSTITHPNVTIATAAGGGSGAIMNSRLSNKGMVCYLGDSKTKCGVSTAANDLTTGTTNTGHAVSDYANTGNGYARIIWLGTSV